jgi:PAS domain S-box-containing protein
MTDAVFAVDHNWSVNLRTGKYMISKGIEKLYGYPVSAFSEDPAFWKRLVHPDDLYLAENEDMERFSGKPSVHQYRMIHANGGVRVIRNRITPILDRSENLIKIVGTFVDITEQERMEQRARESQEWLSTTLTCIGDSVIAADITGKITFMNPVAETLTAWKQEEALGKDVREVLQLINEQTRKEVTNPISKVMKEKRSVSLANHTILINKEGAEIPIDDSAAPILNDRGDMTGIVMVFRDVIERRRYEETIKHYAFHDALTGLPNRRLCNDRLTIALTNAKRNNKGLATMFLDLDCFKLINDTWGHELSRVVRSITDKLAEKFIINGQALFTSSSIGTSFYPNDGKMKKRSRNYRLLEN